MERLTAVALDYLRGVDTQEAGPGIPVEELEDVLEPFYRVEQSRSRVTGGSGLGLAVSQEITRVHGGELILRNRQPCGLEAIVTLPLVSVGNHPALAKGGCTGRKAGKKL